MPSIPKTNTLNLLKIQCICLYDQHNAEYIQCVCSVSTVALLFLLGSHICEATCMAVCPLKRPSFLLLACTSAIVLHASASTKREFVYSYHLSIITNAINTATLQQRHLR